MEALIQHFLIYSQGFTVPAGEAYVPVEGPRGEHGTYIVSDGTQPAVARQDAGAVVHGDPGAAEARSGRPDRRRRRRDRIERRRHGRLRPVSFHPAMEYAPARFHKSERKLAEPGGDVRVHAREPGEVRRQRRALSGRSAEVGDPLRALPRAEPAGIPDGGRDGARRAADRLHARRSRGRRVVLHDVLHEAGRQVRAQRLPHAVVRAARRRARHRGTERGDGHQAGRDRCQPARSRCSKWNASAPAIARRS